MQYPIKKICATKCIVIYLNVPDFISCQQFVSPTILHGNSLYLHVFHFCLWSISTKWAKRLYEYCPVCNYPCLISTDPLQEHNTDKVFMLVNPTRTYKGICHVYTIFHPKFSVNSLCLKLQWGAKKFIMLCNTGIPFTGYHFTSAKCLRATPETHSKNKQKKGSSWICSLIFNIKN